MIKPKLKTCEVFTKVLKIILQSSFSLSLSAKSLLKKYFGPYWKYISIVNNNCKWYHNLEHHSGVAYWAPRDIIYIPRGIIYDVNVTVHSGNDRKLRL